MPENSLWQSDFPVTTRMPHVQRKTSLTHRVMHIGLGRFWSDDAFGAMNGIGDLLTECINAFPSDFRAYQRNKPAAKERLRRPMSKLAELFQDKRRLRAFLNKSIFNGGEVNYLTVKHEGIFHVFLNQDVVQVFSDNLEVCNSRALTAGQTPEQKVLFRYNGLNMGELEMRNDSEIHYREVRFNMIKPKVMNLLFTKIPLVKEFSDKVWVYGNASKRFGHWE
ncbi:MAG: hypothetical protein HY530_04055 [Chloroflexi bacterium]|nr:hypothetical protein [Chloroflexota bacterium]